MTVMIVAMVVIMIMKVLMICKNVMMFDVITNFFIYIKIKHLYIYNGNQKNKNACY